MDNGDVQLISLDNKYKSIKLDFSFPQDQETEFKFVYYDMQKFYFLHADKNKYDTVISMENNDPLGSQYISKIENFFVGALLAGEANNLVSQFQKKYCG